MCPTHLAILHNLHNRGNRSRNSSRLSGQKRTGRSGAVAGVLYPKGKSIDLRSLQPVKGIITCSRPLNST
jgi:hypothetical protein